MLFCFCTFVFFIQCWLYSSFFWLFFFVCIWLDVCCSEWNGIMVNFYDESLHNIVQIQPWIVYIYIQNDNHIFCKPSSSLLILIQAFLFHFCGWRIAICYSIFLQWFVSLFCKNFLQLGVSTKVKWYRWKFYIYIGMCFWLIAS